MMTGDEGMRASDAERTQAVEKLQQALVEGRLSSDETTERIEEALNARTRGELVQVLRDLPAAPQEGVVAVPQPELPVEATDEDDVLPRVWLAWGVASAVCFVVYLMILAMDGTATYPWFLWVSLPWGTAMLGITIGRKFLGDR